MVNELIARLGADDLRGKLPTNPNHNWTKRDPRLLKGLVFHQSLGWSTLEQINHYHTSANSHLKAGGVHSISYTFGIRRSGKICLLNDLDDKVWSQGTRSRDGDENAEFLSVVLEGLFKWSDKDFFQGQPTGEPTVSQLQASLFLWETCAKMWEWGIKDVYGHYHFGKESCPGNTMKNLVDSIRNQFDFSQPKDITLFLNLYGFKNVLEFQKEYNKKSGSSISQDGIWGKRESQPAAYWWIQNA